MITFLNDWFSQMFIVCIIVLIYVLLYSQFKKRAKTNAYVGILCCAVILFIAGTPVIQTIFFREVFPGPNEGFYLSFFITLGTIIILVKHVKDAAALYDL